MVQVNQRPKQSTAEMPNPNYTVKRLMVQVELEFYDPKTGKVTNCVVTEPAVMYEAEFEGGIEKWLTSKNVKSKPFSPPPAPEPPEDGLA